MIIRVLLALVTMSLALAGSSYATELYVSPKGNDAWAGTIRKPFATLERARDAIQALKKKQGGLNQPVTVHLRKGTYFMEEAFTLGAEDSGTKDCPIIYSNYKHEPVIISGGRLIGGFKPVAVNGKQMLATAVPGVADGKWNFTQLFVNGHRRPRTRLPGTGYYTVAGLVDADAKKPWKQGQDKFRYAEGEIKPWQNLADVDVVALHVWMESRMQIKSVDEPNRIVHLNKPSVFRLTFAYDPKQGGRYWLENVFEALDTPGQWYLDRGHGKLYYYPLPGEDAKHLSVIAPKLERLIVVGGNADDQNRVRHVTFRNLRFVHTEPTHPTDMGGYVQAEWGVAGAIQLRYSSDCSVENCDVSQIGNYGVEVDAGCEDARVERNRIADMGAGGVKLNPGSTRTLVADNDIGDGGRIFMGAIGVWVGDSGNNQIIHNHIHDQDYTGVSVGWVWGYTESKAVNNLVEYNHIHDIGRRVFSDMGGIYTLGVSPGTRLRNNLIHDCYAIMYGGRGIHCDEGSTHILIENNVIYNTSHAGIHLHYGKENVIRNNILAFGEQEQLMRAKKEPHLQYTFEHNIVYYDTDVLIGRWPDDNARMDFNCYWNAAGKPVNFAGATLGAWQGRGLDVHSVVADPLFVNPKQRDFTLKKSSPAFKLGFKPIALSTVGPRFPVGPAK